MRRILFLITIIGGFLLIGLTQCQKDDMYDGTTGRLIINITDDPFPIDLIEEASVIITKVEIRKANENEGYPFVVLSEETVEFNLLELRNGLTANLVDLEVPVGDYDLIRLYVDEASLKLKDGDVYNIKVPSGAQTGIKVFINPDIKIVSSLTAELLLDFSLEKSFVLKGDMNTPAGINGFNFKPVIRAVNNSTAGRIEGMVSDTSDIVLENASVWVEIDEDSVVATASTDASGFYAIIGIPAGYYSVYATKENYDTVAYHNIEIIAANLTVQNFELTPEESEEPEEE